MISLRIMRVVPTCMQRRVWAYAVSGTTSQLTSFIFYSRLFRLLSLFAFHCYCRLRGVSAARPTVHLYFLLAQLLPAVANSVGRADALCDKD
jgi:hypothetical protein